jgi:hypothetical protein
MAGVWCRWHHTEEGGGKAWVQLRHAKEDSVGVPGVGARLAGAAGGCPVRMRQGMRGEGGPVGRPWLGRCHEPAHAHSAAFDLKRISN